MLSSKQVQKPRHSKHELINWKILQITMKSDMNQVPNLYRAAMQKLIKTNYKKLYHGILQSNKWQSYILRINTTIKQFNCNFICRQVQEDMHAIPVHKAGGHSLVHGDFVPNIHIHIHYICI